jgi:adenine-specific DNA-methyltransferase
MKIFISGSRTVASLPSIVCTRLDNIINKDFNVLVGDCYGVDKLVQEYFHNHNYSNVTVYHISNEPRFNVGNYKTVKVNSHFQTSKDKEMAKDCDYGFIIIHNNSNGSMNNILTLKRLKKKSLIFDVNKDKFLE